LTSSCFTRLLTNKINFFQIFFTDFSGFGEQGNLGGRLGMAPEVDEIVADLWHFVANFSRPPLREIILREREHLSSVKVIQQKLLRVSIMKIDFSRGFYFATFTKVKGLIEILEDLT
jgi:hypothetical protein